MIEIKNSSTIINSADNLNHFLLGLQVTMGEDKGD